MDTTTLPTPEHCLADFCLIPIGTASASVSAQVADVQRLIEQSGVKYVMHSAGTTLEGSWDRVHQVIGQAHTLLHKQGIVRIQTDIRVGSRLFAVELSISSSAVTQVRSTFGPIPGQTDYRTDKEQTAEDKVNKVRQLLAQDKQ